MSLSRAPVNAGPVRDEPVGSSEPNELSEVERCLRELAAGNADVFHDLRSVLHRVVASSGVSGAVKALVVQALLLLDDPRVREQPVPARSHLVLKIRKLLESAVNAHVDSEQESRRPFDIPPPQRTAARPVLTPGSLLSPDTDPGLVEEFVVEAREQLGIAEASLLTLDGDPSDMLAVDSLFRALHTIKGTSAFLGVEHATELAHHAEGLLARVRSGTATCTGELSNLLFRAVDMLDAILVAIETAAEIGGAVLPDGHRALLVVLRDGGAAEANIDAGGGARVLGRMPRFDPLSSTVRIRVADLGRLADAVRELALTHGMLVRDATVRGGQNPDLARKVAHAERLGLELEELTMGLQTVTLANTMQRLVRAAHDVAQRAGKSIEIDLHGDDVVAERALADMLSSSLLHIVRNAIDHGIESAAERSRAGKPSAGLLRIAASQTDSELVIELADDGRGLDAASIRRTAVAHGIIARDAVLNEQETFALILRPGFSTVDAVTDVSGRGVGLDVVRTSVDAVGGSIEILSRSGQGTAFTIRLPHRTVATAERAIGRIAC